jgi:putative membrane protein
VILADVAIVIVALLHAYFLMLEMFLWDKPFGRRTFGMSKEKAEITKPLAMNQGLYNGFLACVIVAGVFGALTASRKILWVQALPGAAALALVLAG